MTAAPPRKKPVFPTQTSACLKEAGVGGRADTAWDEELRRPNIIWSVVMVSKVIVSTSELLSWRREVDRELDTSLLPSPTVLVDAVLSSLAGRFAQQHLEEQSAGRRAGVEIWNV